MPGDSCLKLLSVLHMLFLIFELYYVFYVRFDSWVLMFKTPNLYQNSEDKLYHSQWAKCAPLGSVGERKKVVCLGIKKGRMVSQINALFGLWQTFRKSSVRFLSKSINLQWETSVQYELPIYHPYKKIYETESNFQINLPCRCSQPISLVHLWILIYLKVI